MNTQNVFGGYPDVVSIDQLCSMLQIGKNTAYNLIKGHIIPAIKVGKQYRIPKTDVIAFLSSKKI